MNCNPIVYSELNNLINTPSDVITVYNAFTGIGKSKALSYIIYEHMMTTAKAPFIVGYYTIESLVEAVIDVYDLIMASDKVYRSVSKKRFKNIGLCAQTEEFKNSVATVIKRLGREGDEELVKALSELDVNTKIKQVNSKNKLVNKFTKKVVLSTQQSVFKHYERISPTSTVVYDEVPYDVCRTFKLPLKDRALDKDFDKLKQLEVLSVFKSKHWKNIDKGLMQPIYSKNNPNHLHIVLNPKHNKKNVIILTAFAETTNLSKIQELTQIELKVVESELNKKAVEKTLNNLEFETIQTKTTNQAVCLELSTHWEETLKKYDYKQVLYVSEERVQIGIKGIDEILTGQKSKNTYRNKDVVWINTILNANPNLVKGFKMIFKDKYQSRLRDYSTSEIVQSLFRSCLRDDKKVKIICTVGTQEEIIRFLKKQLDKCN